MKLYIYTYVIFIILNNVNLFDFPLDDNIQDDPTLILHKIYWALNIIATDIAFGITFLYWTVIYDGKLIKLN